jgi:hypothetical protein
MALLSFEEIAKTDDVSEEIIPISEWNGEVKVKALTRRQIKDVVRVATKKVGKDREIQADVFEKGIIFYGLVHPKITEDQYEVLLEKNTAGLQKILDAIMRLSKMTDEENADAQDKEEEGRFLGGTGSISGIPTS